ncbi:MAG: hypothetical protein ACK5O2_06090 [Microthrixaceae bacterium]
MTTRGTQEEAWTWPCPYCGTTNSIDAAVCPGCHAQLRDPEEDDLFTTVATDNAQMVDPEAPRVRESLWSTDVPPEEIVVEEVPQPDAPLPDQGWTTPAAPRMPAGAAAVGDGPFSARVNEPTSAPEGASAFATGPRVARDTQGVQSPNAFARDRPAPPAPPDPPRAGHDAGAGGPHIAVEPPGTSGGAPSGVSHQGSVTPDENGLSVAVERLTPAEREACAVPIGVCGALLGDQEVVLGLLAGHLLGHAAVMMLTNTRILVSNARLWKPLLDQFLPAADLAVHVRHDRTVASVTIVTGDRLSTVDDIADVPGAMDMAERIRQLSQRIM